MKGIWITIAIYFLAIILLGFWLVFRFDRSEFWKTLLSFLLATSTFAVAFIVFNILKDTDFGKWVGKGWRGNRNLMTISFLSAFFLVVLPAWLFIHAFWSFVNYPPLIEVGASRFLDKAIT